MPDVQELMQVVETNVRKWGTTILAIMAPDAPVPTTWFGASDRLPILPVGAKQMGFITTDGVGQEDSISSEVTNMLQTLEPVRTDLTGLEKSLTVAFGEDNAFVQALWHGLPFEEWPERSDGAWEFTDTGVADYPYYRLLVLSQDGVGAQARYRVEFAYRAKITAKTARTMNRTDAETYGVTFGLFKDPVEGKSYYRAQNGPGYPEPDNTTPVDAQATATLDGDVVDSVSIDNGGTGYTTAPEVVFSGGGGSGASATATVSGGSVVSVDVDNGGSDYTSEPSVSFVRD